MSALLWRLADRVYPETHCGFRAKRSAFDMILSLGQLYVAFIDPTKAFNLVSCDGFYWIFTKIGCPHKLLMVMQSFRSDRSGEFWWGQFRGFQHVRWYETRMCASPTLLASSLPSCWNIPSMHLRRVFSSIQDQMESYSICPDWGPRPKYTKQSSGTCSLLMMWAWLPALDSCCRSLWTNSHKPVKTLAWLSALKKTNMLGRSIKHSMRLLTKFSVIQGGFLQQWNGDSLLSTTSPEVRKQARKGNRTLTSAMPVQCSANIELSVQLKAGCYVGQ